MCKISKLFITSLLMILLSTQFGYSQEVSFDTSMTSSTKYYRQITMDAGLQKIRDRATSPLTYSGTVSHIGTTFAKRADKTDRTFEALLGFGSLSALIPESDYLQSSTSSLFVQIGLGYTKLWKINILSNDKNNIKVGGKVLVTQNIRSNANLANNASGFENLSNLMLTGQISRDISRKNARQLNLWLFKPTLKPINRALRFQINAGLLNFNYRPGYTYSSFSELNGTETSPILYALSNYNWSMNGWRLASEIEYITYLPNGNAKSWSYVWDAAGAPGQFETFQMASHKIRFSYYFQTIKN